MTILCPSCNDTGHACENHPHRPWGGLCCDRPASQVCEHGACHCGGAGMPCPSCCGPIPEDGSTSISAAFTPRHPLAAQQPRGATNVPGVGSTDPAGES